MQTEIICLVLFILGLVLLISLPLGSYMGKLFNNEKTWLDPVLQPIDNKLLKWSGIQAHKNMSWQQNLIALLTINATWFLLAMLVLTNMGWLPLNPDGNPSMNASLAFNTAISFVTNTNLQHYAGENGVSYLGQLILMLFQFISAATGIAIAASVIAAMQAPGGKALNNFYVLFIKSCTRILLPLSIVLAVSLLFLDVPMTFNGKTEITTLEGQQQTISSGPVAAFVAIKHLGTNGGGFFGANSAHPFENPNYLSGLLLLIAQMIIPIALLFAMGNVLKRKRLAWMIFAVMTLGFLLLVLPTMFAETKGNPALQQLGIAQNMGNMEGKEMRFGAASAGFWSIATTVISTGSVNAMHDSFLPQSNLYQLLGMMINAFYGGCGVGFLNCYIYIILAVFISSLMVGRTPEFLGRKIEVREMKIAMLVALLHPLLILAGTAIATAMPAVSTASISNPGFHGFSQMLYETTSAAANNGSGLEGLSDNSNFWNLLCGVIMLLARFLPIIGPVAIAGMLAAKQYIPESNGTLKTDTSTFGIMLLAVMVIVAALAFFPALTLGPIADYFTLY